MRFPAPILLLLTLLCPAHVAAQATLNKCIDAKGTVTYTNKPCLNARKAEIIEIDPAPIPDPPRANSVSAAVDSARSSPAPSATIKLEPQRTKTTTLDASNKQCDSFSDKLGKTLDKMDQARRKGYTLEQMNKWNEDVNALRRQQQQAGCF